MGGGRSLAQHPPRVRGAERLGAGGLAGVKAAEVVRGGGV